MAVNASTHTVIILALAACSNQEGSGGRPLCNPPICRASCDAAPVDGTCDPMGCPPGTAMLRCVPPVSLIACECDGRRVEIDRAGNVLKTVRQGQREPVQTRTALERPVYDALESAAVVVLSQRPFPPAGEGSACHLLVVIDGERIEWDVDWPDVHGAQMRPFVQDLVRMLPDQVGPEPEPK